VSAAPDDNVRELDDAAIEERLREARAGVDWLTAMETGDFLLEERLGTILRVGVRASTVCLAIGLALALTTGDSLVSKALMNAGLIALMATPVARVATAVIDYGFGRDWAYFTLTSIVLLELCAGIVAALVFRTQ
jgi:uncharacterized membrane protein